MGERDFGRGVAGIKALKRSMLGSFQKRQGSHVAGSEPGRSMEGWSRWRTEGSVGLV